MNVRWARLAVAAMLLLAPLGAQIGRRRDPMTEEEADRMREAAQNPTKRFKVLISITSARLEAIDALRSDPKLAKERGTRIHDLLEDFTYLVDEVDANLDDFNQRKADMIKPLTELVEAEDGWKLKLRALKETGGAETKEYQFVLADAIDAVNDSSDAARKELEDIGGRVPKTKSK